MKLQSFSLRRSQSHNEKWVQEQIAEDPSLLGLGDLVLKDKERIQPRAGRLDILLQDPETLKRYEVEIQLGPTDETHLVRTIEYWDIERRRYPQYEHVAVIVAEEITSRFLNVIQLFNGHIPLIALKMTAYSIGDQVALTFVKVLDEMSFGLVDDDELPAEVTDRDFWTNQRASEKMLKLTDKLLEIVREVEPAASLNYNKHYIGLKVQNASMNFVQFMPRKAHVIMLFKIAQTAETDEILSESTLEPMKYDANWKLYRIRVDEALSPEERVVVRSLIQRAYFEYTGLDRPPVVAGGANEESP